MQPEVRELGADGLELRADDGPGGPTITGYGAVYNSPSLDLGGFREIVAPGAFKRSLQSRDDIRAFFNHDPSLPLGSRRAGNMTLEDDERGLRYTIDPLPNTSYAADLVEAMRAKLVRGSSFTFLVRKDEWVEKDGVQVRTLLDVDLFELGPVTTPAYPRANSQVRAMLEARGLRLDGDAALPVEAAPLDVLALLRDWQPTDEQRDAALALIQVPAPPSPPPERWRIAAAARRRRLDLLYLRPH